MGRSLAGRRRRILLALYHFPPDSAVGGLRVAKFARTLPELGWEPYVLTVQDEYREQGLDPERLKGLENVPTVKTRELPTLMDLYSLLRIRLRGKTSAEDIGAASVGSRTVRRAGSRESSLQRLKRYAASLSLMLPDEKKNWSLYAAMRAVRLIRAHDIDWIYTSGPPFSVHVIGLVAKAMTRVRWVADFRDPWIELLQERSPLRRSALSDRLEHWMEASVMTHADKVITTTDRMRESFASRYPTLPHDKFVCLPNSIDSQRLNVDEAVEKYAPLTITYAGTLYFDRTPEPLFRAVGALIEQGKVRAQDIRLKFIGYCRHIEDVETMTVARRYGLESVVEIADAVPHSEAIRIMRRSHLLLVLAPERHKLVVPAKIYDYLGSGTKVLALAEAGATVDLMRETDCGRCFSQSDTAGLQAYLLELLAEGRFRDLRNEPSSFAKYDVKCLTERLVCELTNRVPEMPSDVMAQA